jgi:hypothetical protein
MNECDEARTLPGAADFKEEDWNESKEKYTVRIGISVWRGRKPTGQGRGVSVFNVEKPKELFALILKTLKEQGFKTSQ